MRLSIAAFLAASLGILAIVFVRADVQSRLTASGTGDQLIVTQNAAPATVAPGGVLTYTVVTTNPSAAAVTSIVTSPFVPAGITYLPDQSDPHCSLTNGVVYCRSDDNLTGYTLQAGGSRSVVIRYQVPAQTCNYTITHSVAAQSLQVSPPPPSAAWSRVTTTVTCGGSSSSAVSSARSSSSSALSSSSSSSSSSRSSSAAQSSSASSASSSLPADGDLEIWLERPVLAEEGEIMTYTIWVRNMRESDEKISVSTYLSTRSQFQPETSDPCWKLSGMKLSCEIDIPAGGWRSFQVSSRVDFLTGNSCTPQLMPLFVSAENVTPLTFQMSCERKAGTGTMYWKCSSPGGAIYLYIDSVADWFRYNEENNEAVRFDDGDFKALLSYNLNLLQTFWFWSDSHNDDILVTCLPVSSSSSSATSLPPVPPTAHLTLALSAPESMKRMGATTFSLTVTNDGSADYTQYAVTNYPLVYSYAGVYNNGRAEFLPDLSDPACSESTDFYVTCKGLALPPGESRSFRVSYYLPSTCPCNTLLHPTIIGEAHTLIEGGYSDFLQPDGIEVSCSTSDTADIALSYESFPANFISVPGSVTYTIAAQNIGTIAEENVVVRASTIHPFLPAQSDPNCSASGTVSVYCGGTNGGGFRLLPGQSRSFDLRYSVPDCNAPVLYHNIRLFQPQSDGNAENNSAKTQAVPLCTQSSSSSSSVFSSSLSSFSSSSSSSSSSPSSSSSAAASSLSSSSQSSSMSSASSSSSVDNVLTGTVTYTVASFVSCSAAETTSTLKLEELLAAKRAACPSGCFSSVPSPPQSLTIFPLCFVRASASWVCAPSC
ncbi:MAG: hypothetical protein PHX87_00015 [Candidatus Peribacteraceae bacterium]|nr:hypothetical protein [Candidatus Peribacteraceae bacterium]MDD5741795.1 hypothetical protein [Candidatus Peribacteraceae bacterium]